jgi:H+/Cl- antiporter ClcA
MKKIKIAIWIAVLAFLGIIVYQNRELLLANQSLGIDLMVAQYQTPLWPLAFFLAIVFLLGWLIAFIFGWVERYKAGKTIKKLQETIRSQQNTLDSMKADIEALKPEAPIPAGEPLDPNQVEPIDTPDAPTFSKQ